MKNNLTLAVIICALNILSCNTTEPFVDNTTPGRRDYEWTVDTLDSFNPVYRIWGSSPEDMWAITTGTFYRDIYHFDGNSWTTGEYMLPDPYGLYSIYGFAEDKIYIGAQNRIYQFDGSGWKRFAELSKDGHTYDIVFDNIWGESPDDFYAFGAYPDETGGFNNSVIAHYLNGSWEMLNTDGLFGIIEHFYKNKQDNKIYLRVVGGRDFTDSTHIYEYLDKKFIKLYSNTWVQGLQADISLINGEVYFAMGDEIAVRNNDKFQTILKVDDPNFYQRIWGRSPKDIFLMMVNGLAHYDGTNIEYLIHYNLRTQIFGAALFDKDVFFLIYESSTGLSLVHHGRLKE